MTSLEYILRLFEVSADQLHIDYVKETPTRLQKWASKNKPPFIALLDLNTTGNLNDAQNNLITFAASFVVVSDVERDPSTAQKQQSEIDANKIALRFLNLVKKNEDTQVNGFSMSDFFRDGSYLGIGKGMTLNITIGDKDDYCDLFCNDSTKSIDCNS